MSEENSSFKRIQEGIKRVGICGLLFLFFTNLSFAANSAPEILSLSPEDSTLSTEEFHTFSCVYGDLNGAGDIESAYFLIIGSNFSSQEYLYCLYKQSDNLIYMNGVSGAFSPGENKILENRFARLDLSKTLIKKSGTSLTVEWVVSFKSGFANSQAKRIYLSAIDKNEARSGWIQLGTCVITNPAQPLKVTSIDGKVELNLKKDSLPKMPATPISLTSLPPSSFSKNSLPQDKAVILSVVDCKPDGLEFNANSPATLTFIFNQAQVPGTPLYLASYEPKTNKFVLTGQKNTVSGDGMSVSFEITHFSSYAAIFIPSYAPLGAGIKIPLPDMLTGSFSHTIPITLPPARKMMQPALALQYRSNNPNSWTGVGFSLNPGYIVRSTRLGPPTYVDTQDNFYFITDAGATELVYLTENVYQARIESTFSRFYKEKDDSWTVLGKDGSILKFGQSQEAKETSAYGTFAWYLTKAVDTNGNYIQYHYIKDFGKSYLSRIDYAGSEKGLSPTNTVEFILEPREDVISSYLSGTRIAVRKRLREILVKVNSELVWRYLLEYEYSPETNRSLLKSITQYGSDGKSFPKQTFSYQRAK